jgi:hypothetical protein
MQDVEERIVNKAEEIAQQRYGREFNGLPNGEQMKVWMEAEHEVVNDIACEADMLYDRMKENKLLGRRNGHEETYWDELELERRLGN